LCGNENGLFKNGTSIANGWAPPAGASRKTVTDEFENENLVAGVPACRTRDARINDRVRMPPLVSAYGTVSPCADVPAVDRSVRLGLNAVRNRREPLPVDRCPVSVTDAVHLLSGEYRQIIAPNGGRPNELEEKRDEPNRCTVRVHVWVRYRRRLTRVAYESTPTNWKRRSCYARGPFRVRPRKRNRSGHFQIWKRRQCTGRAKLPRQNYTRAINSIRVTVLFPG